MRRLLASFAVAAALVAADAGSFAAGAADNCTCRGPGRSFELGESACLPTPKGPRMATCIMVLNNTSWQFSETPCVSSKAAPRPGRALARYEHRGR